jgi:hypothetical protein
MFPSSSSFVVVAGENEKDPREKSFPPNRAGDFNLRMFPAKFAAEPKERERKIEARAAATMSSSSVVVVAAQQPLHIPSTKGTMNLEH